MFKQRSMMLFITMLLGIAYTAFILLSFKELSEQAAEEDNAFVALFTILLVPHIVVTLLATLLMTLSFVFKSHVLTLVSSITYLLAAALFVIYGIFLIPVVLFGFIAYSRQKRLNKSEVINIVN